MRSPKGKGKQAAEAPRGGALAFKHLQEDAAKRLLECPDPAAVESQLLTLLDLGDPSRDLRAAALLDYYASAVLWSRGRGHNAAQLSSVYSVVHELLEALRPPTCRPLLESVSALKLMLADVGAEEVSPLSGGLELLGGTAEAAALTSYVSATLLQHHSLFEFLFTRAPAEELLGCDLHVETAPAPAEPPFPPPLPEGLPEALFRLMAGSSPARGLSREASAVSALSDGEAAAEAKGKTPSEAAGEAGAVDVDAVFGELSPEEVARVVAEVCKEQLAGVEREVAVRLREKENEFIARINKVHKVAPE